MHIHVPILLQTPLPPNHIVNACCIESVCLFLSLSISVCVYKYLDKIMCSVSVSRSVVSNSLRPHGLYPARLLCPWGFPGKNIRVGCHCFLQGIFLTWESDPGLLNCRRILYHVSYRGSPK